MSKDRKNVVARLRARITPEQRIMVKKNLAVSAQIEAYRKLEGWSQKEMARRMGKTESEVSKWLSGTHNFTFKTIAKLEAVFGKEIVTTPMEACEKYKSVEYVHLKVQVRDKERKRLTPFKYEKSRITGRSSSKVKVA